MKLILAIGLIVTQAAVSSGRSVSKALGKESAKNNIAGLILPFLNDQDDNHNILEVIPYGNTIKKNKWKELKRVAAITPLGKKEKKKGPLAIILTTSKMNKLKKRNKLNGQSKHVNFNNFDVDLSYIASASDEDSSEEPDKHGKKKAKHPKLIIRPKSHEGNGKKIVNFKLDDLIDDDSDDRDAEVIKDDFVSLNSEELSVSDIEPKRLRDDIKGDDDDEGSLDVSHPEIDLIAEDSVNESQNEGDHENNSSINSVDVSKDESDVSDDVKPTIYVVETDNHHKHSHDKSNEPESQEPESLETISDFRKNPFLNNLLLLGHEKTEPDSASAEKLIEAKESKETVKNTDADANTVEEIEVEHEKVDSEIPEHHSDVTKEAKDEKVHDSLENAINIEDQVNLDAVSEPDTSSSSKESQEESSTGSNNNSELSKSEKENNSDVLENDVSDSESNDVADENDSGNDAVSNEMDNYGFDEPNYSQEASNEYNNDILPPQNFNNYDEVNEVIEELNEDIIKEIEKSQLTGKNKEVDCSKNTKDKEGRKLYNLSFVFNKK